MAIELNIKIYEVEPNTTPTQTFCAETKFDHLKENDVVGYGSTPEETLEGWLEEIKKHEVFRGD